MLASIMARLSLILIPLLSSFVSHLSSLPQSGPSEQIVVGGIYYFGYSGLNLAIVQDNLPIRVGDSLDIAGFDHDRSLIETSVMTATEKSATDVAFVCCDKQRRLLIYIGLPGNSSRVIEGEASPHGSVHLDPAAYRLYEEETIAMANAARYGSSREDDSNGYAIADDPAAQKIELAMRTYAANRGLEIEKVLQDSGDVQQRRASAALLGYANRSTYQIEGLIRAINDPDETVRNNALRALAVLASAKGATPINIDANVAPLIDLLFSKTWSDRNKSSFVLAQITKERDQTLLKELGDRAMAPLIEGANWDTLHSTAFLEILGRIGGIPEVQLNKLILSGDKTQIIRAAQALKF